MVFKELTGGSGLKNPPANATDGQEDPRRREWQPTPVFLPGESPGQRRLAGYSPWGHKDSDTTSGLNNKKELIIPGIRTNSDPGHEKQVAFYGSWGRLWNNFRKKHFWDLPLHSSRKIHPFPGPEEPAFRQAAGVQHWPPERLSPAESPRGSTAAICTHLLGIFFNLPDPQ